MAPIVALTGFMGSGKTTVGQTAAQLLGWTFVDLDAEVVASAGRPIPCLFIEEGEGAFRQREYQTLVRVLDAKPHHRGLVLALGGGTVTNAEALDYLRSRATVVYLQIDAEHAWSRVDGSDRPLAQDRDSFAALLSERQSVYEAAADHVISVRDRTPLAIAGDVVELARTLEDVAV